MTDSCIPLVVDAATNQRLSMSKLNLPEIDFTVIA